MIEALREAGEAGCSFSLNVLYAYIRSIMSGFSRCAISQHSIGM